MKNVPITLVHGVSMPLPEPAIRRSARRVAPTASLTMRCRRSGGIVCLLLAVNALVGCAARDCDCNGPASSAEAGQALAAEAEIDRFGAESVATDAAPAEASSARLRGPRTARPRAMSDEEHPQPLYPLVIDDSGRDASGTTRLRRDFPHTATTPVRYGLLHAHTWYSDGSGTPADAFARAAQLGLDFLAVTEHNHAQAETGANGERRDGVLIATQPALFSSANDVTFERRFRINGAEQTETVTSPSLIRAAEQATTDDFVGIVGQEFSSISSGNHINALGWNQLLTVANGDFPGLYAAFGAETPVLQLNHPDIHLDMFYRGSNADTLSKMFNDYGFDDFSEDFAKLVETADKFVMLIELLTGPAFAQTAHASFHYEDHENDYYYYLIQGFHISPSVGHDNHFRTWGDATPARMGVFADQLTPAALLEAMRANRTFASEDSDLRIDFLINDATMGDVLTLGAGMPLRPQLTIADASDPDSEYTVKLIYGDVQPQTRASRVKWVPADGLSESLTFIGEGQVEFDEYVVSGLPEFFYVHVKQGDGDQAWSAPIWINHPRNYTLEGEQ